MGKENGGRRGEASALGVGNKCDFSISEYALKRCTHNIKKQSP